MVVEELEDATLIKSLRKNPFQSNKLYGPGHSLVALDLIPTLTQK
jgi:hypothetical protein